MFRAWNYKKLKSIKYAKNNYSTFKKIYNLLLITSSYTIVWYVLNINWYKVTIVLWNVVKNNKKNKTLLLTKINTLHYQKVTLHKSLKNENTYINNKWNMKQKIFFFFFLLNIYKLRNMLRYVL